MIKKTMEGVKYLVQNELDMACVDHGKKFNSGHEAHGIIREELEELEMEVKMVSSQLGFMWMDVKNDDKYGDRVAAIEKHAMQAACEAIQVAAMARKACQ